MATSLSSLRQGLKRMLPSYAGRSGFNRTLGQAVAPFMRYTHGSGAPIPQRGIVNYNGYQIPGALLAQMRYESAVNKGRVNPMAKYLGGMPNSPNTSDEVRKAYLRKISSQYSGQGAMNPYIQAQQVQDRISSEMRHKNLVTAQRMGIQPQSRYQTFKQERLSSSGQADQATLRDRQQRKQRQQEFKRQQQTIKQGQAGRTSMAKSQDIGRMVGRDLKRLRNIGPTTSNLKIKEKVINI